jgi:lipopolysaccharide export system protein LptA
MHRLLRILLIISLISLLPGRIPAQDLKMAPAKSDMIDIESDRLDVNTKNGTAVFKGKARATKLDTVIKGDILTVSYDTATRKVKNLTAEGHAYIHWKDREATCSKVVYNLVDNVMVLTGNVIITRGEERITGEKITADMKNDSQVIEGGTGRVKVRVNSGKETGVMQWGK